MSGNADSGERTHRADAVGCLPLLAFALFLLAVKLCLIAVYASPIPFGDQWNGEAQTLFRPFMTGQLHWSELVAPFLEHRIFTTRVLDLLLLLVNGDVWNPMLEIVANAGVHILALSLLVFGLLQACPRAHKPIVLIFSTAIFAIPFGIENTLWGFQSQFYFELLFSFCFMWTVCQCRPLSRLWWAGLLAAVLAALSLASGPVSLLAGVAVLVLRAIKGEGRSWPNLLLGVAVSFFAVWIIAIMPVVSANAGARVASLGDFFMGCVTALSWPALPGFVLLIYLPFFQVVRRLLGSRTAQGNQRWFVLGIGLWLLGQVAVLSYGRSAADMLASRYMDIFVIGLPLNLVCIFISKQMKSEALKAGEGVAPPYMPYEQLWLLLVLGFSMALLPKLKHFAESSREVERVELANVRTYVQTGNADAILGVSFPGIPFPDPILLKEQLDIAAVRYILPPDLVPANGSRQNALLALMLGHLLGVAAVLFLGALTSLAGFFAQRREEAQVS